MGNPIRLPLRIVFYYEEDRWVAHCLEFDLVGCGESKEEALRFLEGAISTQAQIAIDDDCPDNLFAPADSRFWAMWATGKHVALGQLEIQIIQFDTAGTEFREVSNDGHAVA